MRFLEETRTVINFIEDHLDKEISLDDIIQLTKLSKFHYIRMFKAITGITVNEYIRRRRLSQAAFALIETNTAILDIAFYYRYESQEAFTRAFKEMFGVTPKVYRVNKIHFVNLVQAVLNEQILSGKISETEIVPIFIERGKMNIIGLPYQGINSHREIPKLWSQFVLRLAEIKNTANIHCSYGYETYTEDSRETGALTYIAGVEVYDREFVPQGMVAVEVPANQYAAFPIPAIIDDVSNTIKRIYCKLLFELELEPCDTYDLEWFDGTFIPNDYNSKYYLCIPIK